MRALTDEQQTTDWVLQRRGRITGSRIADVLATLKRGGESASRLGYKLQLVAERTTGEVSGNYVSPEMAYGTEYEQFARAEYEIESGNRVDEVGFILHPKHDFTGASPDGLVGLDGAVEFKVPKSETHCKWLDEGILPPEHEPQCAWVLACTERKWIDFVSFDPRQKWLKRLFTVRMFRDDVRVAQIEAEVIKFHEEIEAFIAKHRVSAPPVEEAPPLEDWATRFAEFTGMDEIPL
jgi:predicted phage-related endonuclease